LTSVLNGLQDPLEPGVEGAVVTLLNADGTDAVDLAGAPVTATTGPDGTYFFDNLAEGTYEVQVVVPDTFVPTANQVTADNDVENDSNIDVANSDPATNTYVSGEVTLTFGDEPVEDPTIVEPGDDQDALADTAGNMTVDLGFVEPVSLGSVVWLDANGNGIQDAGEAGIAGATVSLFREDPLNPGTFAEVTADLSGGVIAPIVTDATGSYFFDNLTPGNYQVQVTTPDATFLPTINQVAADNAVEDDSNIDLSVTGLAPNTFQSGVINLVSGEEAIETGTPVNDDSADDVGGTAIASEDSGNMTVDFGFIQAVSIGSVVFEEVLVVRLLQYWLMMVLAL